MAIVSELTALRVELGSMIRQGEKAVAVPLVEYAAQNDDRAKRKRAAPIARCWSRISQL